MSVVVVILIRPRAIPVVLVPRPVRVIVTVDNQVQPGIHELRHGPGEDDAHLAAKSGVVERRGLPSTASPQGPPPLRSRLRR